MLTFLAELRRFLLPAQASSLCHARKNSAPGGARRRPTANGGRRLRGDRPKTCRVRQNAPLRGGLDLLAVRGDRDRARFHAFGQITDEIDVQEAVLELGALDLDVVGELEAALE